VCSESVTLLMCTIETLNISGHFKKRASIDFFLFQQYK
jgi:hypothetical protein